MNKLWKIQIDLNWAELFNESFFIACGILIDLSEPVENSPLKPAHSKSPPLHEVSRKSPDATDSQRKSEDSQDSLAGQ